MKKKINSGFSLLEVVISMLILSIVVPGAFAMVVTTQKQLNGAKNRYQAQIQAETILEGLRNYVSADTSTTANTGGVATDEGVFADLQHDNSSLDWIFDNNPIVPISATNAVWSYTVADATSSNCRMVTVTVSWEEL